MSLLKLAPLIKETKKIYLYRGDGQWIGNSGAAYNLYDVPGVVEHNDIFNLLGIVDAEKKSKFHLLEKALPETEWNEDGVAWGIPFIYYDEVYQIIFSKDRERLVMINEGYLKPLTSEWKGLLSYCIDGDNLLIRSGFLDLGIIFGEPVPARMAAAVERQGALMKKFAGEEEPELFEGEEE